MNVIVPGFAVTKELFNDFLQLMPDTVFLSNDSNTYLEANDKLNELSDGENKINFFGWSMGSLFSLKWTLENPDKVNSVFLTGATARFCEKEGYDNGIQTRKLEQMMRMIKIKPELIMNDFYKTILSHSPEKEKYYKILTENMPDRKFLVNGLNELAVIDLIGQLDNIKTPVCILQGNEDAITPLKGAEILNSLIKNSVLKTIDGGHCLFLENATLCSNMWKDFLCHR